MFATRFRHPRPGKLSDVDPVDVALADALEAVGDRWSLLVLRALADAPLRFGEIEQRLGGSPGGIAPNVLIQRLRHLERRGVLVATPYSHRPVRMSYSLTDEGRSLQPALGALAHWATRRSGGEPASHAACGTELELRPWCPTCERVVDPDHDELHHL